MSLTLSSSLHPTQGFHTTSTTKISSASIPLSSCKLELSYTLPPLIFVDPYELALRRTLTWDFVLNSTSGNPDLEKPVHAVEQETAELKVYVDLDEVKVGEEVVVDVPMHLRYPETVDTTLKEQYASARLNWPVCIATCAHDTPPAGSPPSEFTATPIPPATPSSPDFTYDIIRVPLGRQSDLTFVETGTAVTILVCFFWLVKVSLRTSKRLFPRDGPHRRPKTQ